MGKCSTFFVVYIIHNGKMFEIYCCLYNTQWENVRHLFLFIKYTMGKWNFKNPLNGFIQSVQIRKETRMSKIKTKGIEFLP